MMRYFFIIISFIFISACSQGIGDIADALDFTPDEPRLPGKREAVNLNTADDYVIDENISQSLVFPDPQNNIIWTHYGGNSHHGGGHLMINHDLKKKWSSTFPTNNTPLRVQPLVVGEYIYVLDGDYGLHVINADNGKLAWKKQMPIDKDEKESFGGGIAFFQNNIFITTGYGHIYAVNASNGDIIWDFNVQSPIRSAPAAYGQVVIIVTLDNQTYAFNAQDGRVLWTHKGFQVPTSISGQRMASIKFSESYVPYSSGEIFALRIENGRKLWNDNLSSARRRDTLSTLADIGGYSVVTGDVVVATSNSGKTIAWDRVTGRRLWERNFGSTQPMWALGNYAVLLSLRSELLLFSLDNGKIVWNEPLKRYKNDNKQEEEVAWTAPIVANERIYIANDLRELQSFDLKTGAPVRQFSLSAKAYSPPVIVNQHLYILTNNGVLQAWH